MRIFSGIQPTGDKHLGNYIGGFRQYAQTQELGEAFFCIVDLHSITVEYDPRDLHDRTLDLFAMLVATGLDPDRSTVFAQSHVTAHAEASWLLSAVTSYGQLGRMTQFKEKGEHPRVRLRGALHVPGADGRRHPPLPGRQRADRRRPATAPRARTRRRGALQLALRTDVRRAGRHLPGGRRPDHGPPGADEEDVDDRRHGAGHRASSSTSPTRSARSSARRSPTPVARSGAPTTSPASRTSSTSSPSRRSVLRRRSSAPTTAPATATSSATSATRWPSS